MLLVETLFYLRNRSTSCDGSSSDTEYDQALKCDSLLSQSNLNSMVTTMFTTLTSAHGLVPPVSRGSRRTVRFDWAGRLPRIRKANLVDGRLRAEYDGMKYNLVT